MGADRQISTVDLRGARFEEALIQQNPLLDDGAQVIRRRWDVEKGSGRTPLHFGLAPC